MACFTHVCIMLMSASISQGQFIIWITLSTFFVVITAKGIYSGHSTSNHTKDNKTKKEKPRRDEIIVVIEQRDKRWNMFQVIFALVVIGAGILLATGNEDLLLRIIVRSIKLIGSFIKTLVHSL